MLAIKQIKICAEYRDKLPRPLLDLTGAPGLRPNMYLYTLIEQGLIYPYYGQVP